MAFSITGILSVLFEVIRPLLPALAAVASIDLVLLVMALRRGTLMTSGAIRLALLLGSAAAALTAILAPALTRSSFSNLSGALDYLSLIGGALAVGLVCAVLTWPAAALFQKKASEPADN
jgi:hypothetical protein